MSLVANLIIGLGIFLFGMLQLERGLEHLSGDHIKRWLTRSTNHASGSVLTGTAITALVQSSSMVSLLVLAFASAGVIPLYNAIGVILGANLGTTISGWLVATLGFKLQLSTAALPLIGVGCFIQVFVERRPRLFATGSLLFGIGMLLMGLGLMKDAVAGLPSHIDIAQLHGLNALQFLLLGAALTAVIQSSSATMMIALTALNSGIIELHAAAALVIGADLGTTSTTALGSLKGSAIKRQLALSHFVFNFVVDLLAFVLLLPLLPQIMAWLNIDDPLYSLVAFHSAFNLLGLLLFIPFLRQYSGLIGRCFTGKSATQASLFDVPTAVPEAAITACVEQAKVLLSESASLNLRNLKLDIHQLNLSPAGSALFSDTANIAQSFEQRYEQLKHQEGELLQYAAAIQQQPLDAAQAQVLSNTLACARSAVYACKTLKDVRPNLLALRHSPIGSLQRFSADCQTQLKPFYKQWIELLPHDLNREYLQEQLAQLVQVNEQLHQQLHHDAELCSSEDGIEAEQLSTLFNINREIWHSGQNLVHALRLWQQLS